RRQRVRQLGARAAGTARDLVAQAALELLDVGLDSFPQRFQWPLVGAAQHQPQGEQQQQDDESEKDPVEGHPVIVAWLAPSGWWPMRQGMGPPSPFSQILIHSDGGPMPC